MDTWQPSTSHSNIGYIVTLTVLSANWLLSWMLQATQSYSLSLLSQSKALKMHVLTIATGQKSVLKVIYLETILLDQMVKISTSEHRMKSWTVWQKMAVTAHHLMMFLALMIVLQSNQFGITSSWVKKLTAGLLWWPMMRIMNSFIFGLLLMIFANLN